MRVRCVSVKGKALFAKKSWLVSAKRSECLLGKVSIFRGCECLLRGVDLLFREGASLLKKNEFP